MTKLHTDEKIYWANRVESYLNQQYSMEYVRERLEAYGFNSRQIETILDAWDILKGINRQEWG